MNRTARVERNTKESQVLVELNLDGSGASTIDTGVPWRSWQSMGALT